jgi:hypothetical protein
MKVGEDTGNLGDVWELEDDEEALENERNGLVQHR